jgi:iron complex transport system ATP-binding protein
MFEDKNERSARVEAPGPLRTALERMLCREGWRTREPAEIVLAATDCDTIMLHTAPALPHRPD